MDQPQPTVPLPSPEGASLIQFILILRRRWRLMSIVWALTLAVTAVHTFTTKKLYRPQAILEIRPETPVVSVDPNDPALMASQILWENYYRTQESILTSPTLVQAVLDALPPAIRNSYAKSPDPVKSFIEAVDIEKTRTSFILKVGFVDADADKATQSVNTLISSYIEDANRRLREMKSGAAEVLSKEALPAIRARIDEADKKIQAFQKESGFMDFEERYKLLIEKYRKLDSALTDIGLRKRRLRAELDALSAYGMDGISGIFNPAFHSTRTLEPLADQRSRLITELAREEKVFKEKHPRLIELSEQIRVIEIRIREAISGTLKSLDKELEAVDSEEKALALDLNEVTKRMEEVGGQKWEYRRLEGELTSAKELYTTYLKKHGETSATSGATLGSVRVVDHASVPTVPFKPRVFVNLIAASVVGLFLGIVGMLVAEQLDDRVRSPRELEAFVGIQVLGVIPRLKDASVAGASPVLLGKHSALTEYEAFRAVRAELVTRLEKIPGGKIVAVLSAFESEGKSTICANLAAVLAMEGRRVLIVDADLRRPSMRALIGLQEGVGLDQVLGGQATLEQAIQRSQVAGVDVLGAVEGSSSAAELAASPIFQTTLDYVRERYDFVLIDSAPVNQVSESALVARRAHGALIVVRTGQTGRGGVVAAKKRLEGMGVRLLGGILNFARAGAGGYGYGYYSYYSYYHAYYGQSDKLKREKDPSA